MRIAMAQINSHLGNFTANQKKVESYIQQAQEKKCDLIVFPELALFGYSPMDLLERSDIVQKQLKVLQQIEKRADKNISALIGCVTPVNKDKGKPYYNSVKLIGSKNKVFHKQLLPSYDVFDETRFFRSGEVKKNFFTLNGKKILVLICEDIWCWDESRYENTLKPLKKDKPDVVISINASPFAVGKEKRRYEMVSKTAKLFKCPVVYVNMVGAQDEVIFDGGSFAVNAKGEYLARSAECSEDLNIVDISKSIGGDRAQSKSVIEKLHKSLVLGLRDYVEKNNFKKLLLGLSGGIDSAVALCLAADAVGPHNVTAIAMPGPFSAEESFQLAYALAKNVGCQFKEIPISDIYNTQLAVYEKAFGKLEFGLVQENLQARIRGQLLMMHSNHSAAMLISTSNKSELATGYSTLYGDMSGGLAPLGDLLKGQVYELARHYNQQYELIPQRIISRPPSAELRPNQKDQDSLPEYDLLDKAVDKIVRKSAPATTETDKFVLNMLAKSEFKRWQSPPILKVSDHSFGRGRRWPISHKALS